MQQYDDDLDGMEKTRYNEVYSHKQLKYFPLQL